MRLANFVMFAVLAFVHADFAFGQDDTGFSRIEQIINSAITAKKLPGAVVCIGSRNEIRYLDSFGDLSVEPKRIAMKRDTVFDLASLTKPIATATSIMILVEEGKVRIRDRVSTYLPDFGQNGKSKITVKQLLTHTAGLIPDNSLKDYKAGYKIAFDKINALPTTSEPGTKFAYSDVGFLVLGEIVRKVSGKDVNEFSQERIFKPLQMDETGFNPRTELKERAAVTQKRNNEWIQGIVHDPRAFELAGVAGHAGLFSTASDLAIFCQMLLHNGKYGDTTVLSPHGVKTMTKEILLPGDVRRSLGWDKLSPYSSNRGELMTESAFGHGGFTGTAIWIDPQLDLFVIFLSNRVHPNGKGSVNRIAGLIGTIAAAEASKQ